MKRDIVRQSETSFSRSHVCNQIGNTTGDRSPTCVWTRKGRSMEEHRSQFGTKGGRNSNNTASEKKAEQLITRLASELRGNLIDRSNWNQYAHGNCEKKRVMINFKMEKNKLSPFFMPTLLSGPPANVHQRVVSPGTHKRGVGKSMRWSPLKGVPELLGSVVRSDQRHCICEERAMLMWRILVPKVGKIWPFFQLFDLKKSI